MQDWPHVVDLFTEADHAIYMAQAHRIISGGPLYPNWELAGPFVPVQLPELYPPPTVYGLFIPMSVLPDVFWWLIPLGIVAGVIAYYRPSAWGWAAILGLLIGVPSTWVVLAAGNPSIWVAAGIALSTVRPTFAIAALAKPTLAPFALLGVRSRLWWASLALYVSLALAMLPAWLDYARVLLNYRASPSLIDAPLMLVPLAARFSSGRTTARQDGKGLEGTFDSQLVR